ncbi:hypothetical protein CROQUDRAFT_668425 [Cronartium quercuum f. sp. fusiforme G11]|uniref:Uncharacterized protein n=1 Tax=Cronartium quercuum f. sp. fusiforme G11 TaxID=708437 RepID=A0A9P6NWK3_9BASI|nr:hypothetical protein CROQUDRAFT_668425 [Cronartium quercuum f. sp. fusiforme G11]
MSASESPYLEPYVSTSSLIGALIDHRLQILATGSIAGQLSEKLRTKMLRDDSSYDAMERLVELMMEPARVGLRSAVLDYVKAQPDLDFILKPPGHQLFKQPAQATASPSNATNLSIKLDDFFDDTDNLISALSYHMPAVMRDKDIQKHFNQRYITAFSCEDVEVAARFINYVQATSNLELYQALSNFCAQNHLQHLLTVQHGSGNPKW